MRVIALADDLSGANEVAAALVDLPQHALTFDARNEQLMPAIVHVTTDSGAFEDVEVTVVNTDSRQVAPFAAEAALREALAAHPATPDRILFLKFDSMLRGQIGVQLEVVGQTSPVLFCPAVPELGRTVRGGVLHVEGRPLHETTLWAAEQLAPAPSVAAQLAPARAGHLALETVRGPELGEALREAASNAPVVICDAESSEDLERIAVAGLAQRFVLAGAAGLAGAVAAQLALDNSFSAPSTQPRPRPRLQPRQADVLFVLGTASAAAKHQAQELEASGVLVHRLSPAEIEGFQLDHEGTVAVIVEAPVDPSISAAITAALTRLARRHHADRHLVLSGGETAQSILKALNISELVPLLQAHPGAVVSTSHDGRLVATRPGSYGASNSLLQILNTMHSLQDTTRKVPS